jgi:GDP-L-fucose synthase
MLLIREYDGEHPINVGNTEEHSIKEVAEMIAKIMRYDGEIIWQTDKPKGQYRKPSDNTKLREICEVHYTGLEQALTNACEWFIMNYPNVRGI